MFEQPDSRADATTGLADSPPSATSPAEAASSDPRIEDYLDHVCAPLVGLVPYARRQELRAELRGHLDALIATHEELGSEREAASVMALRQFGPPRDLSRRWAREWVQGDASAGVLPPWRAMGIALISFGAATLVAAASMAFLMAVQPPYINWEFALVGLIGTLLPALAGLVTGLQAPARPALGTFYALALLILPAAVLAGHALAQPGPGADNALSVGLAFLQPVLWVPVGCLTAALGGSLRSHLARRPRPWVLQ